MKSFLLAIALTLVSSACSAQEAPVVIVAPPSVVEAPVANDVLFHCEYKYDRTYNIVFLDSHRVIYHPPSLPELTVYRIIDIRGGHWAINEYDWLNYTCTETTINVNGVN